MSPHPSPAAHSVTLLLADARLPGGGHAHSAGLEPAILGGMPPGDARAYLAGRATTVSLVEAGVAVVAMRLLAASASAAPEAAPDLRPLARAWAARTPSPALREASRLLGRGYLRVAHALWGEDPAVAAVVAADRAGARLPRPVLLGAIAAAAGLDAPTLVRLTVYDDAQAAASALLKLEPLDPLLAARWVLDACAAAEPSVPRVSACTTPEDVPASGAPQSEGWAQAHARTTRRLFRA